MKNLILSGRRIECLGRPIVQRFQNNFDRNKVIALVLIEQVDRWYTEGQFDVQELDACGANRLFSKMDSCSIQTFTSFDSGCLESSVRYFEITDGEKMVDCERFKSANCRA